MSSNASLSAAVAVAAGGCGAAASARCSGACVTVAPAHERGAVRYGGNSDGQGRRGQVVPYVASSLSMSHNCRLISCIQ